MLMQFRPTIIIIELFEILLPALAGIFSDWLALAINFDHEGKASNTAKFLICVLCGMLIGLMSLAFLPMLLHTQGYQIANLLVVPAAFGYLMLQVGKRRLRSGKVVMYLEHFWCAWGFAMAVAGTRWFGGELAAFAQISGS